MLEQINNNIRYSTGSSTKIDVDKHGSIVNIAVRIKPRIAA